MTPEDLKSELSLMDLPKSLKLSDWEDIADVKAFLEIQFQLVEQAGDRWERTPAWGRLTRLYEAMNNPG